MMRNNICKQTIEKHEFRINKIDRVLDFSKCLEKFPWEVVHIHFISVELIPRLIDLRQIGRILYQSSDQIEFHSICFH